MHYISDFCSSFFEILGGLSLGFKGIGYKAVKKKASEAVTSVRGHDKSVGSVVEWRAGAGNLLDYAGALDFAPYYCTILLSITLCLKVDFLAN